MTRKHYNEIAEALFRVKPKLHLQCPSCDHGFWANHKGECPGCKSVEAGRDPRHAVWLTDLVQWEQDVQAVAFACQVSNNNFQRTRFVQACENGL